MFSAKKCSLKNHSLISLISHSGFYSLFLILLFFFPAFTHAQCLTNFDRILPEKTISTFQSYGYAVAIHGNYFAVGAYQNDSLANNGGIVYIYKRDGESIERIAILHPPEIETNLQFGYSIDLNENTLIVSSKGWWATETEDGVLEPRIYIFEMPENGWHSNLKPQVLLAPEYFQNFGEDIKISADGKNIYASAPYSETGSVFSFRRGLNGWNSGVTYQEIKPDPKYLEISKTTDFGENIIIQDNYLVIGGDMTFYNGKSGGLFVYKDKGNQGLNYTSEALLQGKSKGSSFFGGITMAIDEQYIYSSIYDQYQKYLIAYPKGTKWMDAYACYLIPFSKDTMSLTARSIEVLGNEIYVMATAASDHSENLFIFNRDSIGSTTYLPDRKILIEGAEGSRFGIDSDSDGTSLLIGNYLDSRFQNSRGSVQLYETSGDNIKRIADINEEVFNATDHFFGNTLLHLNEHLLVGAPDNSEFGSRHGLVHIYQKQNGKFIKKGALVPEDNERHDDSFGGAMVNDGNRIAIGAPSFLYNGRVFLYKNTSPDGLSLELEAQIDPPESMRISLFGAAVALEGDLLAIAAMDKTTTIKCVLFIYEKDEKKNWALQHIYSSENSPANIKEVFSVDIHDGQILIGRGPLIYGGGNLLVKDPVNNEWKLKATFGNTSSSIARGLGKSVKITEDHIFLSHPSFESGGKKNVGSIFVYSKPAEGWKSTDESVQIIPFDTLENGLFGYSFQEKENTLFVGAPKTNLYLKNGIPTILNEPGSAYIIQAKDYRWEDYSFLEKLTGRITHGYDAFGAAVILSEDHFFTSATREDTDFGFNSGAVYVTNMPAVVKMLPPVCEKGSPLILKASPHGGSWDGAGITNPVEGIFDPSLAGAGKHLLTYSISDCEMVSQYVVEVQPSPFILSNSKAFIQKCKNQSVSLFVTGENILTCLWYYKRDAKDSFTVIEEAQGKSLEVTKSGFYYCEAKGISCSVNSEEFRVEEEKNEIRFSSSNPQYLCSEGAVKISVNTVVQKELTWYFRPLNGASFIALKTDIENNLWAEKEGQYFCEFQSESCVFYSDTLQVLAMEMAIKIDSIPTICNLNRKVSLKASPEGGMWFGPGITDQVNGILDPDNLKNGKYQIEYLIEGDYCQYKSQASFYVDIIEAPLIKYPGTEICFPLEPFIEVENSGDFDRFEWYRIHGNDPVLEKQDGFMLNIQEPGQYFVKGYRHSCTLFSDTLNLTVLKAIIKVPNVFTPNNDSFNRKFTIKAENIMDFHLRILNRWGKNVFTTRTLEDYWDAEGFPSGVYYWIINYTDCRNEKQQLKGYVQVLR